MIESVRDYAIFMLDTRGYVLTWNEGARRYKGYEPHEIIGKHFSVFYTPEDASGDSCAHKLEEAIRLGRVEDEGWRVRKDGSKFWANVVITALFDQGGEHVGFSKVTRDLTDRKKMELQLKSANDDLEVRVSDRTQELQKAVSARDEFISIASHELKTPLTALRLQAQIAKRQIKKGISPDAIVEHFGRFADQIDSQVERLRALVDDMLDVTRIQRGQLIIDFEEVNLSSLVTEVVERYRPEIEKSGSVLSIQIEKDVSGVWDRFRIEQVVLNLLSNAAKYGEGKPVELRVYCENKIAFLCIRDEGRGIDPQDQKRIFERFERAGSANISGLGLGLYITRQILLAHNGDITVRSAVGEGSEFIVSLPLDGKNSGNQTKG